MIGARLLNWTIALLVLAVLGTPLHGQGILDNDLEIAESLRPFDHLVQSQLRQWIDARDAALTDDGKQTPQWWEIHDRLNPIGAHGTALLNYARDHAGTPEARILLAYIVDWGEGQPAELFRSACDELVAHYSNDLALSWVCSRCTNALSFDNMKSFLTRVRDASSNPTVQAAADFHLAQLLDHALQIQRRIPEIRENFEAAGALRGQPDLGPRLETVAKLNSEDLRNQRDELLKQIKDRFGARKPWSAKRTFGRLDYKFFEDTSAPSFYELADGLLYEITNLREGCRAPDFEGTLTDGRVFRLQDRRGKPTLLMFSFKGCGSCEAMYPALRSIQQRFSQSGFSVIGVMADEKRDTITAAIDSGDISWPCVWDGPSGRIAEKFRVQAYPTVLLLDGEGRIAATGLRREEHLVAHIETLANNHRRSEPKR